MHRNSHYIKTQSLSFYCNKQELGTELYEHSSSFFYEQLMPKVEQLFDSLVPQDQYINIDRLEIEISIDERNWNSGSCCQMILEEISSQLKQDIGSGKGIEHFKTLEETKEEKDFKWEGALKIYLQDGYLPWNMDSRAFKSQLKSLSESSLIAFLSTNWLKEIVFRSSFALDRLFQLIELEKLSELKGSFATRKRNWKVFGAHFSHAFESISTKEIPPKKWSMWEFSYLLGREAFHLFPELIDELSLRKDKQFWHELANLEDSSSPLARNLARDWQDAITSFYKSSDNSGEGISLTTPKPSYSGNKFGKTIQKTYSTDTKHAETVYAQDGIYVNNAGLVLVYPFLSHYFQKTELMDENESFHGSIAQEKAAILLHYLLYTEPPESEHELVLNKLLCGIPLRHAIDLSSRMDKLALKEGKKMLKAVINNWEALGSTDVPSLTEAFLTRKGKLEFKSSHIHLFIQKESMDILLGRIPWTLSFVKLPFMQKLIKIDW